MRTAIGFLFLALSLPGCSGNPENDVLPVGSQAVVTGEQSTTLDDPSESRLIYPQLEPGTRVTIGHDPGYFQETNKDVERSTLGMSPQMAAETRKKGPQKYAQGSGMAKFRGVKVVVESGKYRGLAGSVSRYRLQPVK